jgi:hypothetical protein
MKRNFFMMAFVSLFTVVALCSCNKDEDDENGAIPNNTITAVVENGASYNSEIDLVKAIVYSERDDRETTLASAPYSNGGFTLNLPASLDAQYLNAFEEVPKGVTISNPNAKIGGANLEAYNKEDSYTGYFYQATGDWRGLLIYVDGNLSISGNYTETETYDEETYTHTEKYNNCNLKKGWNMIYIKETEKTGNSYEYEYTTQAPAGVKWHFYESGHYDYGSLHKQAPSLSAKQKPRF